MEEGKIVYFESTDSQHTEEVLRIANLRADELGIRTILLASTRGNTASRAVEVFKGKRVVIVRHATGYREPNTQEFIETNQQRVVEGGAEILTSIHAFSGIGSAMRKKFNMSLLEDIIAGTLRIFGMGMKVACEISLMAADAGLVRTDEDVIAIAGTGRDRGADTAVVLRPVNTRDFFDLKIKEILCKPHFEEAAQPERVSELSRA